MANAFRHPDALGFFPEPNDTALLWDPVAQRGQRVHIRKLRRKHPRPPVYCPGCGLLGEYAHTDRVAYFRHANHQACADGDLETALHLRAKRVLCEGVARLRDQGRALVATLACGCGVTRNARVASNWAHEAEEVDHTFADRTQARFDVALLESGVVAGLEVKVHSACRAEKLEAAAQDQLPLVEVEATDLVGRKGEALWTGEGPLPIARDWRLPDVPMPLRCSECSAPPRVRLLRHLTRTIQRDGAWAAYDCTRCRRKRHQRAVAPGDDAARYGNEAIFLRDGTSVGVDRGQVRVDEPELRRLLDAEKVGLPLPIRGLPVCRACRNAGPGVHEVDAAWRFVAQHAPTKLDLYRFVLGNALGTRLEGTDQPFAVRLVRRPEEFEGTSLEDLARRGLVPTDVLQLLSRSLNLDLSPWTGVADLATPHAAVEQRALRSGRMDFKALATADRLARLQGREADHGLWGLGVLLCSEGKGNTRWRRRPAFAQTCQRQWDRYAKRPVPAGLDWTQAALGCAHVLDGPAGLSTRRAREDAHRLALAVRGLLARHEQDPLALPDDLHPEQARAVRVALGFGFSVVTGAAGTGKTRVIQALLDALGDGPFVVAAPTGKAASRLRSALGDRADVHAGTVAKLLRRGIPEAKAVVVDEAGFMDTHQAGRLMACLAQAEVRPLHVVFVGDPNQLPSVGAGRMLADLVEARDVDGRRLVPQAHLTTIHRSGQGLSGFGRGILHGHLDWSRVEHLDVPVNEGTRAACARSRAGFTGQMVSPTKKVVRALNQATQARRGSGRRALGRTGLLDGDTVICQQNHYDDPPIMNGESGVLEVLDQGFQVHIDGEARGPFSFEHADLFDLAYAVTVHKSQGSEWDEVMVVAGPDPHGFCDRAMLYTAATRARKRLTLVGPRAWFTKAASEVRTRDTLLRHALEVVVAGR